jgi:hypothetical protein
MCNISLLLPSRIVKADTKACKGNRTAGICFLCVCREMTHPAGTVFIKFFFPDGDYFFNTINSIFTALEGFLPVPGTNNNYDNNIANIHSSDTVDNSYIGLPLILYFIDNFFKLFLGHAGVGLVFKISYLFTLGIISHCPGKGNQGSMTVLFYSINDRLH